MLTADLNVLTNGSTQPFGTAPCGAAVDLSYRLANIAGGTLTVANLTLSGPDAASFSVALPPVSPVPTGGGPLTARFRPTGAGPKQALLTLVSNDPDEGTFQVVLTGSGVSGLGPWRQFYFGSPDNAGAGANGIDFDLDGLPNLVEYAFALNPLRPNSAELPRATPVAGKFGFRFSEPGGVTGNLDGAEWSTTLQPGDWHPISDAGSGSSHIFEMPAAGHSKMFLRLVVTTP